MQIAVAVLLLVLGLLGMAGRPLLWRLVEARARRRGREATGRETFDVALFVTGMLLFVIGMATLLLAVR